MTSFRATLEEVERAELLLHVRDASSPMVDEQKAQVEKVLAELDVSKKPVIEVLNKIDLVAGGEEMPMGAPGSIAVSGLKKLGLDRSAGGDRCCAGGGSADRDAVSSAAVGGRCAGGAGGRGDCGGKRFEGNLAYVTARGPASLLNRYRRFRERAE